VSLAAMTDTRLSQR